MEKANESGAARTRFQHAVRALRYRNFRLFFAGQGISLIGTWMQGVAMSWLVYRLTGSAFMLGAIGFCGQLPTLILPPITGVVADRWHRRKILMITQSLAMLQAFAVAALVLSGTVAVWQLFPLSILLGCINAFDIPARQSLVCDMVEDRADLGNAIALNSSLVNGARLIGPSLAGILIAWVGEGVCFLANGISYVAVIAALWRMKPPRQTRISEDANFLAGLRDGFSYATGFTPVRDILLLLALVSLMGMPYSVLMPVFAEKILGGGPHTLGFLMSAAGIGALGGAFYLAMRTSPAGLGRVLVFACSLFGVSLFAFSFSTSVWLSVTILVGVGLGMIMSLAGCNTILQTIVDDDKRGRVMSFYTMAFVGMVPFGSLLSGFSASHIGAPMTVRIGGAICVLGALLFATRLPHLRELSHAHVAKQVLPNASEELVE